MTMLFAPSSLHLLEDLLLGAVADGQHRDDRRDAEQNAERREAGAELVVRNRFSRGAAGEHRVREELLGARRRPRARLESDRCHGSALGLGDRCCCWCRFPGRRRRRRSLRRAWAPALLEASRPSPCRRSTPGVTGLSPGMISVLILGFVRRRREQHVIILRQPLLHDDLVVVRRAGLDHLLHDAATVSSCRRRRSRPRSSTASSGIDSTFGTDATSMAFDVVMPGRSVVSAFVTSTFTSNTFESWFGRCSPTLAIRRHRSGELLRRIGVERDRDLLADRQSFERRLR